MVVNAARRSIPPQLRFVIPRSTRKPPASLNFNSTANLFRIPSSTKCYVSTPRKCGMEPGSEEIQINTAIQSSSWFGANLSIPQDGGCLLKFK